MIALNAAGVSSVRAPCASANCKGKAICTAVNDNGHDDTATSASSLTPACEAAIAGDARAANRNHGPGIEAANMIRKGQVLDITQQNLHGQAWFFGFLLRLR